MSGSRRILGWSITGSVLLFAAFWGVLSIGSVGIPLSDIFAILGGNNVGNPYYSTIIWQTRLPMAIGALCSGATLSLAGLMLQTLFQNPLAGPSVLGISSGASFGVAVLLLSVSGVALNVSIAGYMMPVFGAFVGALAVILVLSVFSYTLKSGVSLLIIGLLFSYLFSSGISLLNYFSPAEEIRSFLVWGLGSFTGLRLESSLWLLGLSVLGLIPAIYFIKPLNALLLGEDYAESVGYSMKRYRVVLLVSAGILIAVPTAFCGPIGFIGMVVPHICRLLYRSSNHLILVPASILFGGLTTLICALIGVIPSYKFGVLPINVITPVIGVPVIIYLLVNRKRLPYFS